MNELKRILVTDCVSPCPCSTSKGSCQGEPVGLGIVHLRAACRERLDCCLAAWSANLSSSDFGRHFLS